MEESNVFNNNFLDDSNEDSFEDKLVLKDYKIIRLIKEGQFLNKVLDKEEVTNYSDRLLNLCCYMNLSLSSVSYISNIIDLAITLSKGNDNINHLDCLLSTNLEVLKECFSVIGYSAAIEKLLDSSPMDSEKYNNLVSSYYTFEFSEKVERCPLSFVVAGVCYSKLLNLKDLSLKVLELTVDVCKDLRYSLENKILIDIEKYNELCCSVIGCANSLFSQFSKMVYDMKLLLGSELSDSEYINFSKSLVDHFGYINDCIKSCNRVISEANNVRRSVGFGGRKSNLVLIDFKINV